MVTTYRIDTSSLSQDEYERFYDAVDRFAFMICVGKPRILEVTWDENEPLEKLVPIPPGCLWYKFYRFFFHTFASVSSYLSFSAKYPFSRCLPILLLLCGNVLGLIKNTISLPQHLHLIFQKPIVSDGWLLLFQERLPIFLTSLLLHQG